MSLAQNKWIQIGMFQTQEIAWLSLEIDSVVAEILKKYYVSKNKTYKIYMEPGGRDWSVYTNVCVCVRERE